MSDGRLFTSYQSRCSIMASVIPNSDSSRPNTMDSYDLRQYMINNAEAIIRKQRADASFVAHCGPCKNTMLPEQLIDTCDTIRCVRTPSGAVDGLGLGRNYGNAHISKQADIPGAFTAQSGGSLL
ncbi:MAG: hypothetical protein WDW38_006581 [Sanguina aurantia]